MGVMIYEPQEDSFLLQEQVVRFVKKGMSVLEIGTGSGILAEEAAKKAKSVLAVDINPDAIKHCKKNLRKNVKNLTKPNNLSFKVSDLFSKINPAARFDVIIFNPPYLPEQKGEDKDVALYVSGGKHGYELTERFLDSAADHLKDDGAILLLFSTLTGKDRVEQSIRGSLMEFEQLSSKKIAFEELFVYNITKSKMRIELESKSITNIAALAHGHRGLIFTGIYKKKKVTIKVQRTDIGATGTVNNESKQLIILNRHKIGPKLLFAGENYFVYEYVDAEFILDYFSHAKKKDILAVLRDVLLQMRVLDRLGLNKEEMHHPLKHVLIKKDLSVVLLDFERCKHRAKVHNVTQFVQFITSGHLKPFLEKNKIVIDKDALFASVRIYSKKNDDTSFKAVLCSLS